jgi:hypothetical protein
MALLELPKVAQHCSTRSVRSSVTAFNALGVCVGSNATRLATDGSMQRFCTEDSGLLLLIPMRCDFQMRVQAAHMTDTPRKGVLDTSDMCDMPIQNMHNTLTQGAADTR